MQGYGITGKLLSWIQEFLCGRLQRVVINGCSSNWCCVKSGVPQGSLLGPLLFILYINDVSDIIKCNIQQYADDTKLYSVITSYNDSTEDLDSVCDWSDKWQLNFNIDKCKHMQINHNLSTSYSLISEPSGKRSTLDVITEEKDLGIWCTNTLSTSMQCHKATAKAMRSLGLIKRTFKHLNQQSLPFLYKTYVRPHLEYCVPVWSPCLRRDMDEMEKVQHRSTKLIRHISRLTCEDRLKYLHLPTLYVRRLRGDLIKTFKILKGFTDIDAKILFRKSTYDRTRGHNLKLYKKKFTTNIYKNFFSNRIINSWNQLPQYVIEADNINSFKNRLDNFWDMDTLKGHRPIISF